MATKWNDLKHKASPEKRDWLKQDALVELEALERSGIAERDLPFNPLTLNEETVEAMKAARRGDLVKVGSIENLLTDLRADD